MTKKEAHKIFSAFCNGVEYPFGGGDYSKCDKNELNYYADLLTHAIDLQIPEDSLGKNGTVICPNCFRRIGTSSEDQTKYRYLQIYCPHCGKLINFYGLDVALKTVDSVDGGED